MKYLKIYTDHVEDIEALTDEEVGRLYRAMLKYAKTGEESDLSGNERIVWPSTRKQLNCMLATYKEKAESVEHARKNRHGNHETSLESDKNLCYQKKNSEIRENFMESSEDKDKDKDKEKKEKEKKSIARFAPPSLDDVRDYCQSRKNGVDAASFVDFYTAKGWKVGNQPMKDWQAAVRTWERRGNNQSSGAGPPVSRALRPPQRKYTAEDLKHIGVDLMGD